MLRFIIRRKINDRHSGLQSEGLETLDVDCPDLERVLCGGGQDQEAYDYREVAGVEVLPRLTRVQRIAQLEAERDALLAEPDA